METDIKVNWDKMSTAYDNFTEKEDSYSYSIEWPCIKTMLPNLENKKVLDLGCGTGRFSFLFEKEDAASILGIDISENMLEIAKKRFVERTSKVEFIQGDISNFNTYIKETYDFIFSSTTFHYISDLESIFRNIFDSLDENGVCIISVMHPLYTAQYPIDKQGEYPRDEDWKVRYLDKSYRTYIQPWVEYNDSIENYLSSSYHHSFSDYMNAIIKSGLRIECIEEPYPLEKWKENNYGRYNSFIETPSYMIIKLTK